MAKVELKHHSQNLAELTLGSKIFVFSYDTLVALQKDGEWYKTSTIYSRTTERHINQRVPEDAKEVAQGVLERMAGA